LNIRDNYIRIEGLQVKDTITNSGNYNPIIITSLTAGSSDIRVSYNIITGSISYDGTDYISGIRLSDTNLTARIYNNLIYNIKDATDDTHKNGIKATDAPVAAYIYNNTIVDCQQGVVSSGTTLTLFNNIVQLF